MFFPLPLLFMLEHSLPFTPSSSPFPLFPFPSLPPSPPHPPRFLFPFPPLFPPPLLYFLFSLPFPLPSLVTCFLSPSLPYLPSYSISPPSSQYSPSYPPSTPPSLEYTSYFCLAGHTIPIPILSPCSKAKGG